VIRKANDISSWSKSISNCFAQDIHPVLLHPEIIKFFEKPMLVRAEAKKVGAPATNTRTQAIMFTEELMNVDPKRLADMIGDAMAAVNSGDSKRSNNAAWDFISKLEKLIEGVPAATHQEASPEVEGKVVPLKKEDENKTPQRPVVSLSEVRTMITESVQDAFSKYKPSAPLAPEPVNQLDPLEELARIVGSIASTMPQINVTLPDGTTVQISKPSS
jgi:hypothetical protein